MRKSDWVAAAVAGLLGAGCAGGPTPRPAAEAPAEYRIGPEDVVEVVVYQADGISRTVPVRPDGKVSLPLVGELDAEGRTTRELADELRTRLSPLVQDPRVTVIVREVNAPRVYVIGEVNRPGSYPLRGQLDVVQVLALAGGFGEFADRDGIVLIRRGADGDVRETFDYDRLVDEEGVHIPRLRPGDTLYVP